MQTANEIISANSGIIPADFIQKFAEFLNQASQSVKNQPIVVDEYACAEAISMSVYFLQKDRKGKRLIPFFRIGSNIRYDLNRVREAIQTLEVAGVHLQPRPKKTANTK